MREMEENALELDSRSARAALPRILAVISFILSATAR